MAVTAKVYGKAGLSLANGLIDVTNDTLKAMLCTSSYTPNQDTHQFKSDVTNEVTGTGYTAGGVTLTNVTVTYDASTNVVKIDCDDPSWAGSSLTARYLVYYNSTPATDATRPLLSYVDFGQDETSASGSFAVAVNAAGVATFTVS